jgi:hypothetical protein
MSTVAPSDTRTVRNAIAQRGAAGGETFEKLSSATVEP